MTDLERAKRMLCRDGYTCVLCKDAQIFTSNVIGISPMLDFLEEGIDFSGFSAADKIVGKAAAMLFALASVSAVHAQVLSEDAEIVLKMHDIHYTYDTKVKYIVNRKGDGCCPMEEAVHDIAYTDLHTAHVAIRTKRDALRKENRK